VNKGMLHTVVLPTSEGSDLALGSLLNDKEDDHGEDTLARRKAFGPSTRLG
jgi:hypothetical protein